MLVGVVYMEVKKENKLLYECYCDEIQQHLYNIFSVYLING